MPLRETPELLEQTVAEVVTCSSKLHDEPAPAEASVPGDVHDPEPKKKQQREHVPQEFRK